MAVAALIAIVAGTVLGVLAALEAGIGSDRWTQSVEAHGRLQLFGFVATFVVTLAFEFLPRLNQQPPISSRLRMVVPASLAIGALLSAAGQLWYDHVEWLVVPGSVAFAAGAVAFAARVWRTPLPQPLAFDRQPLFLRASSAWLVLAAALTAWGFARSDYGIVPLDLSRAAIETFLRGFVLLTIVGIGLRALTGHLGLAPLSARRQLIVLVAFNASLVLWLAGLGLGALPRFETVMRVADVGYALSLLLLTAWLGVLRGLRPRRGASAYSVMIPIAWAGLALYALALAAMAVAKGPGETTVYQEGAVRHIFLLGFMIPFMIGMAHIVLARFGTGQLAWPRVLGLAFAFATAAWPLRVVPPLISDPPSDAGKVVMATAGGLLVVGLALLASVCARTALLMWRRQRAVSSPGLNRPAHSHLVHQSGKR